MTISTLKKCRSNHDKFWTSIVTWFLFSVYAACNFIILRQNHEVGAGMRFTLSLHVYLLLFVRTSKKSTFKRFIHLRMMMFYTKNISCNTIRPVLWHLLRQYKWNYPGNATITKHNLLEASKEKEMRNKEWQVTMTSCNTLHAIREELKQRNRNRAVNRKKC